MSDLADAEQVLADMRAAMQRRADRLKADLAAGRIWSSSDAGQEDPYRPRNERCDRMPFVYWAGIDFGGFRAPRTGLWTGLATPLLGQLDDDGVFTITALPTEGDQHP